MLSNTAERKPSPKDVGHDGGGSRSTGIIDAHSTSESKNTEPLNAPGSSDQPGRRHAAVSRIAPHTAAPRNGKAPDTAAKRVLTSTLTTIAAARISSTMATRTA